MNGICRVNGRYMGVLLGLVDFPSLAAKERDLQIPCHVRSRHPVANYRSIEGDHMLYHWRRRFKAFPYHP